MTDKATPSPASVDSVCELLNICCVTFAKWKELGKRGRTAEEEDTALREMRDAQENFRAEVERLAAQAAPTEAEYNPLLIDGVQHDPLCLKVYRSPLKECDCGASSRAAQPSQAPVVQAVQAREYPPLPEPKLARVRCDECEGSGFLRVSPDPERSDEVCSACRGRGWSSETLVHVEDDIRAFADATCAMRASSGATTADVRMLTDAEQTAIIDMHNTGRAQGDHECVEDIQRKFCAVNAGKRIPADGVIGSAA